MEVQVTDDAVVLGDLWSYRWSARRRPFLHPVRTPSGVLLTRDSPPDHPWHHALWFTVKFVNGENFWEEYGSYGVLRHEAVPSVETRTSGVVEVRGTLRWIGSDRETVLIDEDRRITHVPLGEDTYAIDLDTTLVPRTRVVLDRTPYTTWGGYGGLTLRGDQGWVDTSVVLDDGAARERVLGDRSRWAALTGPTAGVVFLDHPGNPGHPTCWYGGTRAEIYGEGWANFLNAAFLWSDPLEVEAGSPLRLRYRVVVHDGPGTVASADAAWRTWTQDASQ